ncbi:MAG: VOC family protein [Chloroflexota bacterium]|nr:VOC family protein [Chloroflexota bacterium]
MANPIVHFEIAAKDAERVRAFYASVFGWPISADNPMNYAVASTKEDDLGIDGGFYEVQDESDRPGLRIYAQVEDLDATLKRVADAGGTIVNPGFDMPAVGIRVGGFLDPEGNFFGAVQPIGQG